jgi:hypothetical protein
MLAVVLVPAPIRTLQRTVHFLARKKKTMLFSSLRNSWRCRPFCRSYISSTNGMSDSDRPGPDSRVLCTG